MTINEYIDKINMLYEECITKQKWSVEHALLTKYKPFNKMGSGLYGGGLYGGGLYGGTLPT